MARISISTFVRSTTVWGLLLVAGCSAESDGLAGLSGPAPSGPSTPAPGSGLGSVTLGWEEPSTSEDGSPLTDLAGYTVYYGTQPPLTRSNSTAVEVGAVSRHTLADLTPGTYYVAVAARDENGNESTLSAGIQVEVTLK